MRKQGKLALAKHLIGDRRPIVAFIGVSALAGCGESVDYALFTKLSTCSVDMGQENCQARYQEALKEAKRTAMKYMAERDCMQDYGGICVEYDGVWQPKIAGFIAHKQSDFSMPFFTSTNPSSSHFGYAFTADGNILGKYRDADGQDVGLSAQYTKALPTSIVEPMAVGVSSAAGNAGGSSSGSGGGSVVSDLATAYIISELIDESGDYLSERERTKRYKECMNRGGKDCYSVSSGTGRISTGAHTGSYKKSNPKLSNKQVKTYKTAPKVTTVSKGGFGNTGTLKGGFGG